jgi:hypothetical protein
MQRGSSIPKICLVGIQTEINKWLLTRHYYRRRLNAALVSTDVAYF